MTTIKVHDKAFEPLIAATDIARRLDELAIQLTHDYKEKQPLFIVVLNGAFIFAADLLRKIQFEHEVSFVKVSSYAGTTSSGDLKTLIGLNEDITSKDIVILEDIVETGNTLNRFIGELETLMPSSVKVATLLIKHQHKHSNLPIAYVGFEIEDRFVLGYGLDYDGLGRNLSDIYVEAADESKV